MIIWFVLAIFFGLIVVGIWYDKIIPPISRSLSRFNGPVGELTAKVAGSVEVEIPIGSSEAFPANTELGKVQYHLNRFIAGKRSLARNLILLAVSIYAFVQLGLLSSSPATILILVVVILIHELGHFIGMKIFGYRNVHIFFIPMFGAATSGIETNPSGSQKAIVSLLGPLPGILIGIILGVLYFVTKNEMLVQPVWVFMSINALNLLPFFPLDGGRFLESLFSSKSVMLEMIFKIASMFGVVLIWFILVGPMKILFGIGIISVILIRSVVSSFAISSTVKTVSNRLSITDDLRMNHIPLDHISTIYEVLKSKLLFDGNPKALAIQIYYVWQRLLNKPPGKKIVVCLIAVYFLSLAVAIGAPVIFKSALMVANIERKIEIQKSADGIETKREVMYLAGKLLGYTTVDNDGLYHGPAESFDLNSNSVKQTGQWSHGKWDGQWNEYDEKGSIIRIKTFENGRFVSLKEKTPEGWIEKAFSDLPQRLRTVYEQHEKGSPQGVKH